MKYFSILLALAASASGALAQQNIQLHINHKLGDAPLVLNQSAENNLGHAFTISRVDYYISSVSIEHDGGTLTAFPGVYILSKGTNAVDVELGTANVTNLEAIHFSIGVEAPVNNEDPAQWPSDHPLNYQSPSMHWGWSSGYRFVCLEGESGPSLEFNYEMHALWNDNYFQQTIPVSGVQDGNTTNIYLDADYREALRDIDVSGGLVNHGTNSNDLTMLSNFRNYVFSAASGSVGVAEGEQMEVVIYPNPAQDAITIGGLNEVAHVRFNDMMGRNVLSVTMQPGRSIAAPAAGTYAVSVTTASGKVFNQLLVVQP